MLRSIGKTCFAYAYACAAGAVRQISRASKTRPAVPLIVCYHRVVEKFDESARHGIPSLLISTAMLERHIDWIGQRYSLVSLDEIGSHLESPRNFRKPPAAITFDDGYSDVFYHGLPLLKRKGVPAAVFAVTGLIGTGRPQIFDRLYLSLRYLHSQKSDVAQALTRISHSMRIRKSTQDRLKSYGDEPFRMMGALLNALPREQMEKIVEALENAVRFNRDVLEEIKPLNWEMITAMAREGVTIGSHTASHALLTSERPETVRKELSESKQTLELQLQKPIRHLAYPDGRFNAAVVQAANSAGYKYAYGTCMTRDQKLPLLTIPRKVLWERSCLSALGRFSSAIMNCHVHRIFDPKHCMGHDHCSSGEHEAHAKFS